MLSYHDPINHVSIFNLIIVIIILTIIITTGISLIITIDDRINRFPVFNLIRRPLQASSVLRFHFEIDRVANPPTPLGVEHVDFR